MPTQNDRRPLGRSGLSTLPLALGGNVFGWTVDEPTSHAVLDAFTGSGFSLIDTADVYSKWVPGHSGGESEAIIGKWLKARGQRDRVLIATKVGGEIPEGSKGLSAAHIKSAVEQSLRRLQTDYIDVYQAHYQDDGVPLEETLGAFAELIAAGKIRALGVSNHDVERMKAALETSTALGLPRYEVVQPLYNLYSRAEFERDIAPLAIEHGLGVISFKALANGFLAGKYRKEEDLQASRRPAATRAFLNARGLRIIDALERVASRVGANAAQVALAWVVSQPAVTAPIASASSPKQVEELVAAVRLQLDQQSLAELELASGANDE